jgi:hypothetical protein
MQFYEAGSPKRRLIGYSKSGTVHYAQPQLYEPGDYLLMGAGGIHAHHIFLTPKAASGMYRTATYFSIVN